jgi:hypothetical protein
VGRKGYGGEEPEKQETLISVHLYNGKSC